MSREPLAVEIEAKFPEIDGEALDAHLREALTASGEIKIVMPLRRPDGTWITNGSYTFVPTVLKKVVHPTYSQRAYLIAQLEAHFARELRQRVVGLVDEARKRNPETTVTLGHFITWTEDVYRCAQQGAEIVMAAHQCPDEMLNDFVRWETNPNWKASMERAGMTFDTRELIWKETT